MKANIAWNTAGCLFYQGCQWLTTIVVVQLSGGYDDAGVLALAMAVGNIFAAIALYKMRTFQVSDIAGARSQGNYAALRLVTLGIAFALCLPYALITNPQPAIALAIMAFLLFKTDECFVDFLYGVDQRGGRMDYIGISQLIRGVVSLGAFSIGLAAFQNLLAGIGCMFCGCLLITLLYDIPHARRIDKLRPQIHSRAALAMLANGLPAVLALVANIAVVSVSRQILGNMCGEDVLGVYASISTPAVLMQAAVSYLYTPMIGRLSEAWNARDEKALMRFLAKMTALVAGSLLVCSALLVIAGPWLLAFAFGDSITDSLWIFPYSILCTALIALLSLGMDVLIVFRRARAALLACTVAFAAAMAAAVPAIEAFGINGINVSIALAYAIGTALSATFIAYAVKHRHPAPS